MTYNKVMSEKKNSMKIITNVKQYNKYMFKET